ncbi:ThuA domain-containing protein [Cellulosimicrobium cellulans]|uniref:ThuA domain-containing protein n=1 Tax=Cellulosimicrobium cellulans TaxID=1710 RepID=UPI0036E63784
MKHHAWRLATGLTATASALAVGVAAVPASAAADEYKVLVVGETLGFRHSHIDETTEAVIAIGEERGFTVDVWDPPNDSAGWWGSGSPGQPELTMDSTPFTSAEDLAQYATIIFASPVDGTNDQDPARPRLLNDSELAALQGYIRDGGGYVGLHAATDTMHAVPWYSELSGGSARFKSHPAQQTATMRVESPGHPSTEMLPAEWTRFDEWYNFTSNPRDDVHVLITLDESTYNPGRDAMGDHPLAWCQNFEGGRSWYEGAGHVDSSYSDPLFLAHLTGGIEWTAGKVSGGGDCVTFKEVDGIVTSLSTGSNRAEKLSAGVSDYLDRAEAAADAGEHAAAIKILTQAKGKAHGLQDATLVAKIADLIEWQQTLVF